MKAVIKLFTCPSKPWRSLTVKCAGLASALLLSGCLFDGSPGDSDELPACTADFRYGLTVIVRDDAGSLICPATVTATDTDYSETLESIECGHFIGAGERPGTYTIEASAEGYTPDIQEGIVVTGDECHVNGEVVQITLYP